MHTPHWPEEIVSTGSISSSANLQVSYKRQSLDAETWMAGGGGTLPDRGNVREMASISRRVQCYLEHGLLPGSANRPLVMVAPYYTV